MTNVQNIAIAQLRADLVRRREALDAEIASVTRRLELLDELIRGLEVQVPAAPQVSALPLLAPPSPPKDGAPYDPEKPETVAAYLGTFGTDRLSFSGVRPRPVWTDASGVTRYLYLGGSAHTAHKMLGIGVAFSAGMHRGYWFTEAEADQMSVFKRERTIERANLAAVAEMRRGRLLHTEPGFAPAAAALKIGRIVDDGVWLTMMEAAQVREHLAAVSQ